MIKRGIETIKGNNIDMNKLQAEANNNNIIDKEEHNKIYLTSDYSKFKKIAGNREIDMANYRKLLVSISEEQLMIPIIVNENFEIIDGQHRFKVFQELGLKVCYMVIPGYTIEQVKKANLVSSNWTSYDYLTMHLGSDNIHYEYFSQLLKKSNMNIIDLLKAFSYANKRSLNVEREMFNSGKFNGEGLDVVTKFVEALEDFSFFAESKKKQFTSAFVKLFFDDKYSHEVMKKKIDKRKSCLVLCQNRTKAGFLKVLANDIYSYGSNKHYIYYDAIRDSLYGI